MSDPYRKKEGAPDCDTKTPTRPAICARCRFKSQQSKSPEGRVCQGSDEYCLADYNGLHPIHGTRSPIGKIKRENVTEIRWYPLEHAVLCSVRNPSGRCDRYKPEPFFKALTLRVQNWFQWV